MGMRVARLSLKWRLSLSFIGVTFLAMMVVALILVPLLARHYAGAQETYLEAAAERAVRDLSGVTWDKDSPQLAAAVERLALLTEARVKVTDASGAVLVDFGAPRQGGATGAGEPAGDGPQANSAPPAGEPPISSSVQPLPNPFGGGLFGANPNGVTLSRSSASIDRPVMSDGRLLGHVTLSGAPDYGRAAFHEILQALGIAALIAIVVAALAGWLVSMRLSRPIRALTAASDRMARGDLSVRATIDRGDEVGQLADSFNAMAGEVERTVAMGERFVADAAHEFGTPLTALQANLELVHSRAVSPDERGLIDASLAEARRLEHLSTDLLQLSRLESGRVSREKEPVDLVVLVRHLGDAVASRAEQKEIDLALDLPDDEVRILGHSDQLAIAFGNLVDNALKFAPRGGWVTLGVRATGSEAGLWVEDSGPGVPPEDLPQLFERFHRGRNAADQPGSGLGLAIVRAVTDLHEGSVDVKSGPGGSRFELRLPVGE